MPSRAVIVHDLADAERAIAAAARSQAPLLLLSAPGAAATLGPAVFREIVATALDRADAPPPALEAVIDCGTDPGYALRAIREGCRSIRFQGPEDVVRRIAEIAEAAGAKLIDDAFESLDLGLSEVDDDGLSAWLKPLAA